MAQKHYHNDYKKLMGVDQSRTGSEKLLDKVSRNHNHSTFTKIQQNLPKKKVKKQREQGQQINSQEIITKIVKSIAISNPLNKIQKGLTILQKCLGEQQFVNSFEQSQIEKLIQTLLCNSAFPNGSLNEVIKVKDIEISVLQKIKLVIMSKSILQKNIIQQIQTSILLLKLISDDSFTFPKDAAVFKEKLFSIYQSKEAENKNSQKCQQQQITTQNQHQKLKIFVQTFILSKLLSLPNSHFEWVRTNVINIIKQFIVRYKQQLKNSKQFLKEYNKYLQAKKSTSGVSSSDIMGSKRATSGGAYSTIESCDSANSWCKRQ